MLARREFARNWVFTINNFTAEDYDRITCLEKDARVYRLVAGHEIGELGTHHIQGYISFWTEWDRVFVEGLLGNHVYLAKARGGWRQNWAYCTKEDRVIAMKGANELDDEMPLKKERLEDAIRAAHAMDPYEFEEHFPKTWFLHRGKVLLTMMDEALKNVKNWDGDLKDKNIWLYGRPGIGKSKWANELFPVERIYKKNINKWWDGYNLLMHKEVLIEDFPCGTEGAIHAQQVKVWGDRYFFEGEVKGGTLIIQPGRFFLIITSNFPIDQCFMNPEDIQAIKRRFREICVTDENILMINNLALNKQILQS